MMRSEAPTPVKLTVIYDESCELCRRSRDWLLTQPCRVEVELLPASSAAARARYGGVPWLGRELVVVDESGNAWAGPAAFLTCLWATVRYRGWAYLLSGPTFAGLAERFFVHVSKRRGRWSAWLRQPEAADCSWCDGVGLSFRDP